jgi:adenylate kinase family enzyme
MDIELPQKLNSQEPVSISSNSIVVIGANGSGKTRFGSDIAKRYNQQTHRISAQKSLSMPSDVWVKRTAKRLDIESTLRDRGRPPKPRK